MNVGAGFSQHVIQIQGDDELSRLARANALTLVRWVRECSGLDLRQSLAVVRALRSEGFEMTSNAVERAFASVGVGATIHRTRSVSKAVSRGILEVKKGSPAGAIAI